ncbi:hypothetical protein [uncultured Rikenella sp.]|uniref:hypothetical protein n=1 Tax=uncultured Rikenella sp. TaxID=368003 RepID=UPI002621001D|nr:hypothetical protein [uncultured Rikenella sp.]
MKKLLFLAIAAILFTGTANAQTSPKKVYCELLGVRKLLSAKVTVVVDFGQNPHDNSKLVDENGKKITFNSMVDAMNYMGELGWEFEDAYAITLGTGASGQNVYHWLLSKYISDDENINDGFKTKQQFKDMQREQENQQQE